MAVTTDVKYLFPANFVEGTDTMGPNQRRIIVRVTGVASDATEATDVVVVDKSDLLGPAGAEPSKLSIVEAEWSISTFDAVIIEWDDGTDEEAMRLSGAGFKDYRFAGGLNSDGSSQTGDIILSTLGAAANASFDISLELKLKE